MSEKLRIFVSATADLEAERGIIARALADLPLRVGAEIRRYPPAGVSYETLFELISNVDRVYFLLGQDITAPSGTEWDLAMELERPVLALRAARRLTPAAQQFLRLAFHRVAPTEWKVFQSDAELARIVTLDLIELFLHPGNRYGLSVEEVVRLEQQRRQLLTPTAEVAAASGPTAAAVILEQRPPSENGQDEAA
ncbi:MAG: hypothetical protein N2383_11685 [Caldilineales bacterium]|nr:hypothetical protein [Caldilineales bacterium]